MYNTSSVNTKKTAIKWTLYAAAVILFTVGIFVFGVASAHAVTLNVHSADLFNETVNGGSSKATISDGIVTLTADGHDGSAASEARITIDPNDVDITTLSEFKTMSWQVENGEGYAPHVDVFLDLDDNGVFDADAGDRVLVFEHAKVTEANCDDSLVYPEGTYNTFKNKEMIDGDAKAWMQPGPPGGCSTPKFLANWHSLGDWKTGVGVPDGIDGSATILRFELEVDGWGQLGTTGSSAEISNIVVNGSEYFVGIQDTIDAAVTDDSIIVANGIYEETVNLNKEGLILISTNGADQTTIKSNTTATEGVVAITADNVTFKGFTVDNQNGDRAIRVKDDTSGTTIKDNILQNSLRGIQGNWPGNNIGSATIEGNTFDVNFGVAGTEGWNDLTIEGNTFNTTDEGIGLGDGVGIESIANNHFEGDGEHVRDYRTSFVPQDLEDILNNNTFDRAVVVRENPITVPAIFTSIQDAIGIAGEGQTVEVAEGTYSEAVTVDKALTLTGLTDPSGDNPAKIEGRVDVQADGVTVNSLLIKNPNSAGDEAEGIFVGNSAGFTNTSKKVTITNNIIQNVRADNDRTVEGIHVKYYSNGDQIDGVVIDGNTIRDIKEMNAGADGIKLQADLNNVEVTNNTIENVSGYWSYGVVLTPSELEDGTPKNVTINNNTINNISASPDSSLSTGVGIDGSGGNGYADAGEVTMINNNLTNVTYGALNKNNATTLKAEHNYWGAASGPSSDGSGNGTKVAGDVDYRPWLLEANGEHYDETIALTGADEWSLISASQMLASLPVALDDEGDDATLLAYENGIFGTPSDNDKPLSAFYAKTATSAGGVGFTYADVTPSTVEKDISAGWNLVGVSTESTPTNAFSTIAKTSSADGLKGITTLNVPTTYNAHKGVGGAWNGVLGNIDISNWGESVLNIYDGYWVFSNAPKTYSLPQ